MDYTVTDPQGTDHVITGPEGASDAEILQAAQDLFQPSVLESAGRAAVNNLPLGGQLGALGTAALNPNMGYSKALENWNQQAAAAKAAHPIAYGAGAVAGSVAPLAIPGVGEAMAAAPATSGAALGAANAVGNIDIAQKPEEALKQGLEGATVGGVTGGLLNKLGSIASSSAIPQRTETAAFAKANGLNPLSLKRLAMMEGTSPETAVTQLADKLQEIVPSSYYSPTSSINEKYAILQQLKDQAGQVIGKARQTATELEGANLPEGQKIIDDLLSHAANYKDVANPEGVTTIQNAATRLRDLQSKNQLTFDTLHAIKSKVGENYQNLMNVKPGTDEIYSTLSSHLDKALERLAPTSDIDPALFQQAKDIYSVTSSIMPLMLRGAGREIGQAFSPLKGVFGLGSLATGHPMGAVLAAGKGLQELAAPELPANLAMGGKRILENLPSITNSTTIGGIDALVSHFISNPSSYGRFATPLNRALQTGGSRGFAATSFILRQQHPELNDIMLDRNKQTRTEALNEPE